MRSLIVKHLSHLGSLGAASSSQISTLMTLINIKRKGGRGGQSQSQSQSQSWSDIKAAHFSHSLKWTRASERDKDALPVLPLLKDNGCSCVYVWEGV